MLADLRRVLTEFETRLGQIGLSTHETKAILDSQTSGPLSEEKSLALVRFDADRVQSHVFASPRPITIQGASAGLRAWDEKLQRGETLGHHAVVLFAGAGQAVVLTRNDHAIGVTEALKNEFAKHASCWPCSVAHVALSPHELVNGPSPARNSPLTAALAERLGWSPKGGGDFGACMAQLALAMRQKKGAACSHAFLNGPSTEARCEECAERPRLPSGPRCERCQMNRDRGGGDHHPWSRARSFDEALGERQQTETQETLLRERHLAFLKLDGKGIGALLEQLRTVAQYTALSMTLRQAFDVRDLTTPFGVPMGRYQSAVAGGDNLLLVLPARWKAGKGVTDAFWLAAKLIEHVEDTFDRTDFDELFRNDHELLNKVRRIGAGAGLVITSGMPASFCFDYADELVTSAKNAIEGEARSAIDFAVLSGGSPLARSLRAQRLRAALDLDLGPGLTGKVLPTRCPYTASDFKDLLGRASKLASVPRGVLHALRAALREPTTGMLAIRYQIARNPHLRAALVDGAGSGAGHELGPWVLSRTPDSLWTTALPDLLDAWPFVTSTVPVPEQDPA